MSNGRQGGWPPQPRSGNSAQSSPSSSSFGDFSNGNPNPNAFQGMQPDAAAAAARYNASIMGQSSFGHQAIQPGQAAQPYGAAPVGMPFYNAPYGQAPPSVHQQHIPHQQQRQAQIPQQQQQQLGKPAQGMFPQSIDPYAAYVSGPSTGVLQSAHGLDGATDPYTGNWVSAIPATYNAQAQFQQKTGGVGMMQQQATGMAGQQPYQQSHQEQLFIQQRQQLQQQQQQTRADEGDEEVDDGEEGEDGAARKKSQKGASEFVKKLFRMLDDTSYASIVAWSPTGDSFIVRDMNDFTKHVLPRHFRHSNFASFVRQLNKYDFHKVKKPDEGGQPQHTGVDQQWEFRHPAFIRDREDILENVRRKVPTNKKTGRKEDDGSPRDQSPTMPGVADAADKGAQEYTQLKDQVATLTASQDQMTSHINSLTKQYQAVIGEMLTFQKSMVQQDQLMQNLIQNLMSMDSTRKIEAPPTASFPRLESGGAFLSSAEAEKLVSNFSDAARGSFRRMSMVAHRAALNNGATVGASPSVQSSTTTSATPTQHRIDEEGLSPKSSHATPATIVGQSPQTGNGWTKGKKRESPVDGRGSHPASAPVYFHPPHLEADTLSNDIFSVAANAVDNPSLAGFEDAGLRVFTVGTLQPRAETTADPEALQSALSRDPPSGKGEEEHSRSFGISVPNLEQLPASMPRVDGRSTSASATPKLGGRAGSHELGTPSEGGANMLRIRRSTYVPGWAVPPKVLVVDDDDVCRKLGSKFLQVFGCAIDVAVDGVTAVNKMNLEKYDLVLMDIVMPNLDGVSATSLIREFDARTPIISMTSNSGPQELLSYMSSGMNDVLPKPFTKEGLLNMLEKHLIHLKTVQKMDEIPRALGLPPLSEDMMQGVLSATAASAHTMGGAATLTLPGDGANPMAALMGNGPEVMRASQDAGNGRSDQVGSTPSRGADGLNGGDEEDGALVNPLAGMGFSDEEYISMLQNLIAAGSVSDASKGEAADAVAGVMGVARGEGASATSGGPRSKESTPISGGGTRGSLLMPQGLTRKRSNGDSTGGSDALESKKTRFTELSA